MSEEAQAKREEHLTYCCGPVSLRFHADDCSRAKLLIGPFGTGKTTSAAWDQVIEQSRRVRPDKSGRVRVRFAVIRNTADQLRDTTIKTFLEWFPDHIWGDPAKGGYNKTSKSYNMLVNDQDHEHPIEIEVLFRALDIEKDVRKLLSMDLTAAWVDEAREVGAFVVKGLLGRMGRFPHRRDYDEAQNPFFRPPQLVLTTNYPSREHWLYRDFVSEKIDGYEIYEQGQEENKHNLPDGYYENLEKDYAGRPDLLRTLVRGEWGVTVRGKQVYPQFRSAFHVAKEQLLPLVCAGIESGHDLVIRGWDNTGLSPACCITYLNKLGQWMLFHEFCGQDEDIIEFGELVKTWCGLNLPAKTKYRDIGDPAGQNRDALKMSPSVYLMKHCQIKVEPGIQTFKIRQSSVVGRLDRQVAGGLPALLVDPGCLRIIDGFEGGYAFREIGNTGVYGTEPDKNEYSHIHDAVQYPATRIFPAGYDEERLKEQAKQGITAANPYAGEVRFQRPVAGVTDADWMGR